MAGELRTSVVLQLVDKISAPLRRITQSFSGLTRRAGFPQLISAGKSVNQAFGKVGEAAKSLRDRMLWIGGSAAAAGWGVERLVTGVASLGNEARISAERLGVGVGWLQEWFYAGQRFNVGNDALIDGFKELALRADEFVMTGGGGAAESFQRLGITVKDLRGTAGETEKLLDLVLSRMDRIQNDAAKQRIFDEMFGGSGGEQMVALLTQSRAELDKLRQAARDNGAVFSDEEIEQSRIYTQQMVDFRASIFAIQRSVVGALLPAINGWLGRMRELSTANRTAISQEFLARIRQVWEGLKTVGRWTSWAADHVGGFGNLIAIVAGLMVTKLVFSMIVAGAEMVRLTRAAIRFSAGLLGPVVKAIASCAASLLGMAARAIPAAIMGVRALSLALLTTPIGWIILGITALAGAVYLIYRNWDGISEWFSGMWDRVTAFFDRGIGDIAKDLLAFHPANLLLKAVDAVFELFGARPLSEVGREWIGGLADGIAERFTRLVAWVREKFGELTSLMPDWAKSRMGISIQPAATAASKAPALGPAAFTNRPSPLLPTQRTDVGGELRIKIDSEGRPRVASMKANGGLDYSVESGLLGVVP